MISTTIDKPLSYKTDWRTGLSAGRKLIAEPKDTRQVFIIMQSMNGKSNANGYKKLLETKHGGEIAYRRNELAERLSDPAYRNQFSPGTVGHAYRTMIEATGYSADGLADISNLNGVEKDIEHPYEWYTRRIRDVHDIWHVLTGYSPDEPLDESCLVAFSFAQTKGPGWATIALLFMLKSLKLDGNKTEITAIWEAFRNGRKAAWLPGQDYDKLLSEPLEDARRRLNIQSPSAYKKIRKEYPLTGFALA